MLRTLAAQTPELHNQQVMLEGWIHRRRRLAAITFVVLRDRSGLAQVVVTDEQARRMVDGLGRVS